MTRTPLTVALGATAALALSTALGTPAQAAPTQTFHVALDSLNDSGAQGSANLRLKGDELTITLNSRGLAPGLPHPQHLHFSADAQHVCPPPSAAGDDGVLTVPEGLPFYGGIDIALTTSGDTSSASGLAASRFPVAAANGTLHYRRTLTLTPEQVTHVRSFVLVQHGIDGDSSGAYDGALGFGGVPQEASLPADCGAVT